MKRMNSKISVGHNRIRKKVGNTRQGNRRQRDAKSALASSIVALVLCCAMLVGTTFAWFTDSVTSGKNKIVAGNLKISAVYQDVDKTAADGYTIENFTRVSEKVGFEETTHEINENTPIINEELWEPGAVGAKLITVKNEGNLAAKIKLDFSVDETGLQDALWFDFVQVQNDAATGTFEERPMSMLSTFAKNLEIPLMPADEDGDSVSFILLYGMYEEAGNEYQGMTFSADVTILAAQYTYEEDSFDETYDKDAQYPTMVDGTTITLKDAVSSISGSGTVILSKDVVSNEVVTVTEGQTATVNLNNKTVSNSTDIWNETAYNWSNFSVRGGELTLTGNGTVQAKENDCYAIDIRDGGKVTVEDGIYVGNIAAVYVYEGELVIKGGTFSIQQLSSPFDDYRYTLNCYDDNREKGTATITVIGGTFKNFNPADNLAEGTGTNFVPDGYKVVSKTDGTDTWYMVLADGDTVPEGWNE